jgi:hypothetical protein
MTAVEQRGDRLMARITDDELDDIRARNPIADVAGGYTKLRRAGGKLVGPCPICGGKARARSASR